MPMVDDWNMVRRMSVTYTQIENLKYSPQCSELTTLFLQRNNLKRISGDFFRWMTSLVLLDLSFNNELSELPEEVSSLVSLQFLNLSATWIVRLPVGLKELTRLTHLDLDYTSNLKEIDVIASLLNLQVLRLFWSVPMNLGLMEDIQRLYSLKELSLTVVEDAVFERLLNSHRLASCVRRLRLKCVTITNGVISLLNAMFSLRELHIFGCHIPEVAFDWRSTIQVETVHSGNIEKIPQFRNIRTVSLHGCNGLRDLTWLLVSPSLDDLTLYKCPQIEKIISKEKVMAELGDTSEEPFQSLTRLSLTDLPNLESIYWTPLPFPVLEEIVISSCPKLRRLPLNSESAKGSQVRLDLDEECIKGVEWEDEATKQRFSSFDNRDFPQMAQDQKMESGESATANSIAGKKVFQSVTHATGVPMEHTHSVSTPDGLISNTIDTLTIIEGNPPAAIISPLPLSAPLSPLSSLPMILLSPPSPTHLSLPPSPTLPPPPQPPMLPPSPQLPTPSQSSQSLNFLDKKGSERRKTTLNDWTSLELGSSFGGGLVSESLKLLTEEAKKVKAFEPLLKDLVSTMQTLIPLIVKIEMLQNELGVDVGELKKVKDIIVKAQIVVHKCRGGISWYKNPKLRREIEGINKDMLKFYQTDLRHRNQLQSAVTGLSKRIDLLSVSPPVFRDLFSVPKLNMVPIGFDCQLMELKKKLLDDSVDSLVVSAPPGCGKTTLVTQLCHDEDIKGEFKHIFFNVVSSDPNFRVIVKNLLHHNGHEPLMTLGDDSQAKVCLRYLLELLKEDGPILLVLDDVWRGAESLLENFRINIPNYKILVTSRFAFPSFGSTYHLRPSLENFFFYG